VASGLAVISHSLQAVDSADWGITGIEQMVGVAIAASGFVANSVVTVDRAAVPHGQVKLVPSMHRVRQLSATPTRQPSVPAASR
jgi:hypothetical protein